ncbi:MAG: hypothetical protein AAB521_00750 [Patescibacteria group bacterium]
MTLGEGTSPTEKILRQTNKDLFMRFSGLSKKSRHYSDPTNRPNYCIDVSLHNEQEYSRGRFIENIPDNFSLPTVVIQDVTTEDGRVQIELATTSYGRLPRVVISSDGILFALANVYLFNEEGQALKYEEIEKISYPEKSLQENLDYYGILKEVRRLDYKIEEAGRFTQLNIGDYEKLLSILRQIKTGELRP